MSEHQIQPVHILLAEDDEVDAEAIVRAFRKQNIQYPIIIVSDGFAALEVLRGQQGQPPLRSPYLILLDLNMPRMSGIEFLHAIRQDPELRCSVVFVLTTSNSDKDKLAAYNAQIAGYFLKQHSGENFINLLEMLTVYWRIVEFPPEERKWLHP